MSLGYQYSGFNWFLSDAGATCDTTCAGKGLQNQASAASSTIPSSDCNMINHFRTSLGLTNIVSQAATGYYTFGYYYTSSTYFYCSNYGSHTFGTRIGETNGATNYDRTRRIVCACGGNRPFINLKITSDITFYYYISLGH